MYLWVLGEWKVEGMNCLLLPIASSWAERLYRHQSLLKHIYVLSELFKLCKILADYDQCIQRCNHSLNFADQDTGAHTQRNENTWWEVKRSMPRTGTSKDPFESYLQQWLWRQHCGDDPFAKTLSSILLTYMKYAKMKNIVSRSYHCMHSSWCDRHVMEERNKTHIFNTWDWIGGRKSRGKTAKDTMKVSNSFISLRFSFRKIEK